MSVNNLQAKPEIIDRKVLSGDKFNASYIHWADMFIDKDNRVFVDAEGPFDEEYLWLNDTWVSTKQYGGCLNGFVKEGKIHLVFMADEQHIDIYTVEKDFAIENHVTLPNPRRFRYIDQAIYVPGKDDATYILSSVNELSSNPIEYLRFWMSGGHGVIYDKPILAEIKGQAILKYQMLPYGGKTNESYYIKEVLTEKDTIHFFGFRVQKQYDKWPTSNILHYAEYNVKKKKLVRAHDIYEKLPYKDENDEHRFFYWHVSADNFNDNLFVVFSWHGIRYYNPLQPKSIKTNMESINSPIYYSQSNGKTFDTAEVIGEGILPLVRADSLGNIHVLWSNSDGDLVHRAKKDGKWSDEQIVLDGVIDTDKMWEKRRPYKMWLQKMNAEFDKDSNLNVVFTSNEQLVYAKIRVD